MWPLPRHRISWEDTATPSQCASLSEPYANLVVAIALTAAVVLVVLVLDIDLVIAAAVVVVVSVVAVVLLVAMFAAPSFFILIGPSTLCKAPLLGPHTDSLNQVNDPMDRL